MKFINYLKAVGTGVKGNRDLTQDETHDMMEMILQQKVPSEAIAAFLIGWRLKPETTEELKASLEILDKYTVQKSVKNSLELGYPFDGKAKNIYLLPSIAKYLEPHGVNLVVSSDVLQPAKHGVTIKDIVTYVDLPTNVYVNDRTEYLQELHALSRIRNNVILRSAFNAIEKLPNVGQSEYAITSLFHKPYLKKYIEIYGHRYKRLALLQGNEGTPEVMNNARLWISEKGELSEYKICLEEYGIKYDKATDKLTLAESLQRMQNPSEDEIKLAKLNAAIYMFVSEKVPSIEEFYYSL